MLYFDASKQPFLLYEQTIDKDKRGNYTFTGVKQVHIGRTGYTKNITKTEEIKMYSGQCVEELSITLIKFEEKRYEYKYNDEDRWIELPKIFQDSWLTAWKEFRSSTQAKLNYTFYQDGGDYWYATDEFMYYNTKDR